MKKNILNNSLSICFFFIVCVSFGGQIIFGFKQYNKELLENGAFAVALSDYFSTGHFIESTFENWESEFLSVFAIIVLSIYLRQIGSSQSKPVDAPNLQTGG